MSRWDFPEQKPSSYGGTPSHMETMQQIPRVFTAKNQLSEASTGAAPRGDSGGETNAKRQVSRVFHHGGSD